jgi:RNA polymerase sigma-70 factor (ECF subfamily)
MANDPSSPKTQWSLIVRAQGEGPSARIALGQLLQRYEPSIICMIRYFRAPPDQTLEELKQEFFTRTLEYGGIAALDRSKGSFRAWLKRAVRNYLANCWDAWNAQKNPGRRIEYPRAFDATCGETPERILDRKFAADTLCYVLERLRLAAPDRARFDALERFLPGPELSLDALDVTAARLGMTSTALRVAIHRLREGFGSQLRQAVADTLDVDLSDSAGKAEVERELGRQYRSLFQSDDVEAQLLTA